MSDFLQALFNKGAVLVVPGIGNFFPGVVKATHNELFWINQWPESQHDVHVIAFDSAKSVGTIGLGYFRDKDLVAYVTLYDEQPDVSNDAAREERGRWLEHLEDPDNHERWEAFVKESLETYLNLGEEHGT